MYIISLTTPISNKPFEVIVSKTESLAEMCNWLEHSKIKFNVAASYGICEPSDFGWGGYEHWITS